MLYARKTHQQAGIITIGSVYTNTFRTLRVNYDDNTESGRSIAETYEEAVTTKSKMTFGGSLFRTVAGVRQTMLTMTLWTLGATVLLGRMRSGSIEGTTTLDEGSPGKDQWEYPFAMATDVTIKSMLQIESTAAMAAIMAGAPAGRLATLHIAMGGFAGDIPVNLTNCIHEVDAQKIQTEDITFKLKGTISPVGMSGDPVIVNALTGSASGAFSLDTGAKIYSAADGFVTTNFGMSFGSGQIIEDNFEFQAVGITTAT